MFTGIITDIGIISEISQPGDTRLVISTSYDTKSIDIGASIACNGICLTVIEKTNDSFAVEASQETKDCTTLGKWHSGERINLERALKLGDELGGHMVSGHVDGVGEIRSVIEVQQSREIIFAIPRELAPFIAAKGSVTIDGVSLTVNEVKDDVGNHQFSVNIIPHTWENTIFADKKIGSKVNLEIDLVARYIARAVEFKQP